MTGEERGAPRWLSRAVIRPRDSRWRKAQRQRLRRMTRHGRATLAAVAAAAASALLWLAAQLQPVWPAAADPRGAEPPPTVATAAPAVGPTPRVPAAVLARLPVTVDALSGALAPPSGARGEGPTGCLCELLPASEAADWLPGPLRVEYTLDAELAQHVFRVLRRGRVKFGHVILLDPATGRVLAYASTDVGRFPPTRTYPAASLVKIITAAAALDKDPTTARLPCRFRGDPYRLTPSRIDPPRWGTTVSLRRALATSNNQCFAQLAVHALGGDALLEAISRFGWLAPPAPAHAAGSADPGEDRYSVGRLGCGLAGCRITPLHAAQLAAVLARGELVPPRWIDRVVDGLGRELPLSAAAPRQVMTRELAAEIRFMLVDTTVSGTARRSFRKRNGRPLLGPVKVAGKTGSLSGTAPDGRYEWFIGAAPAADPQVAVAVLLVQGELWWKTASQIAAEVLSGVFCSGGACTAEAATRWTRDRGTAPCRYFASETTARRARASPDGS